MSRTLLDELTLVKGLVREAGGILLDGLDRVTSISTKRATELVTEFDGRVEDFLLEGLARYFPDDHFLAEESGEGGGQGGRIWYVDPLDGTTNFAHGYPFFSVSVACADADRLLLGAVYAPYLDELYLATAGGGAILERPERDVKITLPERAPVDLEQSLLATGFPYVRDQYVERNTGHVAEFLRSRCHGVRRGGSAAIDLVHVAAGKLDGYWEYHLRPWDSAAGTLIARECGARVTGFDGKEDRLHYENILAAAPGLHGRMLEILQRAQPGVIS